MSLLEWSLSLANERSWHVAFLSSTSCISVSDVSHEKPMILPAVPSWAAPIIGQGLWETKPLYPVYYSLKILFHYPSIHLCLCRSSFWYYEPFKWYELQTALKVNLFITLGNFKVLLSNVFSNPCNSLLLNLVIFISSLIVVVQPYLCFWLSDYECFLFSGLSWKKRCQPQRDHLIKSSLEHCILSSLPSIPLYYHQCYLWACFEHPRQCPEGRMAAQDHWPDGEWPLLSSVETQSKEINQIRWFTLILHSCIISFQYKHRTRYGYVGMMLFKWSTQEMCK